MNRFYVLIAIFVLLSSIPVTAAQLPREDGCYLLTAPYMVVFKEGRTIIGFHENGNRYNITTPRNKRSFQGFGGELLKISVVPFPSQREWREAAEDILRRVRPRSGRSFDFHPPASGSRYGGTQCPDDDSIWVCDTGITAGSYALVGWRGETKQLVFISPVFRGQQKISFMPPTRGYNAKGLRKMLLEAYTQGRLQRRGGYVSNTDAATQAELSRQVINEPYRDIDVYLDGKHSGGAYRQWNDRGDGFAVGGSPDSGGKAEVRKGKNRFQVEIPPFWKKRHRK